MKTETRLHLIVLPASQRQRDDIICSNPETGMQVHFASWQTLLKIMSNDMPTRPIKAPRLPYRLSVRAAQPLTIPEVSK